MKKTEFLSIVEHGSKMRSPYMAVKIVTEGMPCAEVIVNPAENFLPKLVYYVKAYNDDMELISAKNAGKTIKIVGVTFVQDLKALNGFVV